MIGLTATNKDGEPAIDIISTKGYRHDPTPNHPKDSSVGAIPDAHVKEDTASVDGSGSTHYKVGEKAVITAINDKGTVRTDDSFSGKHHSAEIKIPDGPASDDILTDVDSLHTD